MRKTSWRVAQAVVGAAILYFLTRSILASWHKVDAQPVEWHLRWGLIIAALIVTWAMYGVLILGWRTVLAGWREWLGLGDSARIWTISSLGSYIPFKVWSIAGMAMMAQQRGVSGAAATGSAIVMQLLSLASGAVIALMLVGTAMLDSLADGWGAMAAIAFAVFTLILAMGMTSPSLTRRIGFLLGRPDALRAVEPGALAASLVANLIAWAGYGIALQLLVMGTLKSVELSWATATGAFAASYVVGYMALFLPAGLGVREVVLITLLAPSIGWENAAALAAASRVILTVNQVGAAVPFLLFRSRPSDTSNPG